MNLKADALSNPMIQAQPSPSSLPHTMNDSDPLANSKTSSPTNDCTQLSSTYVSAMCTAQFNVLCNAAFYKFDILGVFVYRFEDCMEVCASFSQFQSSNATRYGVTFDMNGPQQGGEGNCFLENTRDIDSTATTGVSSAELVVV